MTAKKALTVSAVSIGVGVATVAVANEVLKRMSWGNPIKQWLCYGKVGTLIPSMPTKPSYGAMHVEEKE